MADPTEVEELDDDDEGQAPPRKNWRKELTGRAEQAEQRAAELERKLAFTEAGLNGLSDKQVKALLSAHEGEVTAAAIKATADELGFAAKAPEVAVETDPEQAQRDQEVQVLAQFAGASQPQQAQGPKADMVQAIQDFKGDYQDYQQWVLNNADSILGE